MLRLRHHLVVCSLLLILNGASSDVAASQAHDDNLDFADQQFFQKHIRQHEHEQLRVKKRHVYKHRYCYLNNYVDSLYSLIPRRYKPYPRKTIERRLRLRRNRKFLYWVNAGYGVCFSQRIPNYFGDRECRARIRVLTFVNYGFQQCWVVRPFTQKLTYVRCRLYQCNTFFHHYYGRHLHGYHNIYSYYNRFCCMPYYTSYELALLYCPHNRPYFVFTKLRLPKCCACTNAYGFLYAHR